MERVDLHAHSNYSDGSLSPAQLIALAEKKHLRAVALTDHNTVNGLPSFLKAAASSSVEAVPGAEFSADYQGKEVHIVGLFIPESRYADVKQFVAVLAQRKRESNELLEHALQQAGYDVHLEEMFAKKPENGQINRADFAAELEEKGYMTREEAFSSVLKKGHGFYTAPQRPDAMQTIEFIRSIGALPILAHPYLSLTPEEVDAFVSEAVTHRLAGMEVFYSTYDEATTELAMVTAAKYGIIGSGGSDFHGTPKPDIDLGTGRGNLAIPASVLGELKQAAGRGRQQTER